MLPYTSLETIKANKNLELPYPPTAHTVDTSEKPNFGRTIKKFGISRREYEKDDESL